MRDLLLSAALARYAANGVTATTLEAIRKEAGASVGSLYHAFPGGKTELTAALYAKTLGDYQSGFRAELERARAAREGIERTVDFHLRWHVRHPDAAKFIHAAREPELRAAAATPLREQNTTFFKDVRAWLAPHVQAGELRDLPTTTLHALWLGPAQEYCRHWLAGAARKPNPTTRRTLADAAWRALRVNPPEEGDQ